MIWFFYILDFVIYYMEGEALWPRIETISRFWLEILDFDLNIGIGDQVLRIFVYIFC